MKKFAIITTALAFLVLSACGAFAHPPKDVSVSWNKSQEMLSITSHHNVNDPAKHYILSLTILDGNRQVLTKQYTKQGSPETFTDSISLKGMKSGTKLRVQLVCNIMGSKETEFIIP
ncbi:MAG: hypothetical protein Q4F74_02655 [Synergistaceae bacterium]|nr:hypothetical protein [Synergistaceae bacterium]